MPRSERTGAEPAPQAADCTDGWHLAVGPMIRVTLLSHAAAIERCHKAHLGSTRHLRNGREFGWRAEFRCPPIDALDQSRRCTLAADSRNPGIKGARFRLDLLLAQYRQCIVYGLAVLKLQPVTIRGLR